MVTATRLRLISGDLSLADAMCDIEMPHYKQNLSSHELEKLILYNVFLVEAIADLLIEKGILTRAEIKERVMRLKAEAPPQPRWLQ